MVNQTRNILSGEDKLSFHFDCLKLIFLHHLRMFLFSFIDNIFSGLKIIKNGNVKLNLFFF